jgi:cytochrome c peroxidase
MTRTLGLLLSLVCVATAGAWAIYADQTVIKVPQGLASLSIPETNAPSPEAIELGKQLFFDPRLSRDNTVSCASCHDPEKGYSNGERFATGVKGQKGDRSAPTVINAAYHKLQFWDGRAVGLEGQALGPIQNPIEMDMTLPEVTKKLNAIKGYRVQFQRVYGSDATPELIGRAIASFERTILSGDAPYDRFKAGDKSALSPAGQRGFEVFFKKAHCSACHAGPNFSDGGFHNIGVGMDKKEPDLGRFKESKMVGDRGSFKTPTLREIARTAPYMHDGSLATLEEVVEYYDRGGNKNPQLDEEMFPLKLSSQSKADLVTFLKEGLSSPSYPMIKKPKLPE